jgi:hypothetical protein
MTVDYKLLFPGRFIAAVEFKGKDVTGEIESVSQEVLEGDKGKENKGIITIKGWKKKWVLNRTNAECLVAMWGRMTEGWVGHRVTLFPAEVDGAPAIRVKGSPELKEPLVFELKLPRKKARTMRLLPTGKNVNDAEPTTAGEGEAA